MKEILKYLFSIFIFIILSFYSIQIFNKYNKVREEGYSNALSSIMFLGVDLVFLSMFFFVKKYGRISLSSYAYIFVSLFIFGIFLSSTYLWLVIIISTSLISLINIFFFQKNIHSNE